MDAGYRALARNPNFALIWLGQTTSRFGDTFYELTLIWLALRISHQNYWSIGLIIFVECAPYLFFGVLGGVYSDRWNRKRLMIVCDVLRGLVVLLLPLLDLLGILSLWHLAVVAFILTTLRTFFQPSLQASVPQLVEDQQMVAANGVLFASYQAAAVLGPIAAGFLFVTLPIRTLFVLDSMTFFVSALTICFIRLLHTRSDEQAAQPSVRQDITEAIQTLRGAPIVLWSILLSALAILLMAGIMRLGLPAFTTQVLGSGPQVYGILMSGMAFGTVIGALLVGRVRSTRFGVLLFLGWIFYGLFLALIGLSAWAPLALLMATLTGGAGAVIDVMIISVIQLNIPEQQLGKVLSFFGTLANLGESVSAPLIGALLGFFAVVPVLIGSGLAAGLVGVVGLILVWHTTTQQDLDSNRVEVPEFVESQAL